MHTELSSLGDVEVERGLSSRMLEGWHLSGWFPSLMHTRVSVRRDDPCSDPRYVSYHTANLAGAFAVTAKARLGRNTLSQPAISRSILTIFQRHQTRPWLTQRVDAARRSAGCCMCDKSTPPCIALPPDTAVLEMNPCDIFSRSGHRGTGAPY